MDRFSGASNSGLVVTRTPLRLSFVGGGTDLAGFYEREPGAVLSTTINKYLYVTVKPHSTLFFEPIRINYSKSEEVHHVGEIENDIARECLRFLDIEPPVYVSTISDLPASTGLGGSSSFAVGLLNALHAYRGERVSAGQLAEEASHIEIDVLKHPIGKQDQYAAAFGGLNLFSFGAGGSVSVESQSANGSITSLFNWLMMFWTWRRRDSAEVLREQQANIEMKMDSLRTMRDHAFQMRRMFANGGPDPIRIGKLLDQTWRLKRELASTISSDDIDGWYERGCAAGARGGKLCGAGGGGFLLLVVDPERQDAVREALSDLQQVPVRYEAHGSQVVMPFVR
jgi:D-glycero-alpha-D-manno-heptose-7-phosphate kinase